jgi:hypothetical protein
VNSEARAASRGPLGQLVDSIERHRGPPAAPEALAYFRATWARLSVEQRLRQSLAKVPANAGPLNSLHLVHRSLTLMRDTSPAYLDRFMAYADALFWVDQGL